MDLKNSNTFGHTKILRMKNVKRMFGWILSGIFLISTLSVFSQAKLIDKYEAAPGSVDISYEKYQLPNGLTLYIHEDHSDPMVHIEVTFKVGSNREKPGMTGFAHFFEHMMFQGSEHVGDEQHFKIVTEAGGHMNGTTDNDRTNYFETVPSNQLEVALWLESDRMGFFLDAITKEKFEVQRDAVKNEKSQNVENQPYGLAMVEILPQTLYPQDHPYSWPVIGYVDDLDRVNHEHLKEFFLRWYGPNNAILVIAGDVNTKETVKLVEKYFGPINRGPEVAKLRKNVPILAVDKYANVPDNVYLPLTVMSFPTVPNYDRDEPALDMLAEILGGGNNSIFYKNFVKSEKAAQASVGHPCKEISGEMQIFVLAYPGLTFNETEKLIRQTLVDSEKEITDEALARVKARMLSDLKGGVESVHGKASQLTGWERLIGRRYNMSDEIKRYADVTKEDLLRVYNKYIKGKNAAIVNVFPQDPNVKDSIKSVNPYANIKLDDGALTLLKEGEGGWKYKSTPNTFDRSVKPTPGMAKPAIVPDFYTNQLANGIKVIGTKVAETPKVTFMINVGGGSIMQKDMKKLGVDDLTVAMMNEGTEKYTSEEMSAALDLLGSTIGFGSGRHSASVFVRCDLDKIDATFKLLEEKLYHPRFDEKDFNRIKKQMAQGLYQSKKDAGYLAGRAYNELLYGNTILGQSPTYKTVQKVSLDDVKEFYKTTFSPSLASVVVVGDISQEDAIKKLSFLNNWKAPKVEMPNITSDFPSIDGTTIYIVHKQNAPQSVLAMGYRDMPYDATGEFYKSNLMNYTFGGAFNSRINLNLREKKGYTYGIGAGFRGDELAGTYTISASVKGKATDSSLIEIFKEMDNYIKNGITDEELAFMKSSVLQSDALDYETPRQKASFLSRIQRYNLPKDYVNQQATIVKNITKQEINELAKKHLHKENMVIVVVGNKYRLKDELEALNIGKVKDYEVE